MIAAARHTHFYRASCRAYYLFCRYSPPNLRPSPSSAPSPPRATTPLRRSAGAIVDAIPFGSLACVTMLISSICTLVEGPASIAVGVDEPAPLATGAVAPALNAAFRCMFPSTDGTQLCVSAGTLWPLAMSLARLLARGCTSGEETYRRGRGAYAAADCPQFGRIASWQTSACEPRLPPGSTAPPSLRLPLPTLSKRSPPRRRTGASGWSTTSTATSWRTSPRTSVAGFSVRRACRRVHGGGAAAASVGANPQWMRTRRPRLWSLGQRRIQRVRTTCADLVVVPAPARVGDCIDYRPSAARGVRPRCGC
jgi:hypothetical protein